MNRSYRITFDYNVSQFVIEIQGFLGLSWKPAKDANRETRYFATFDEAQDHIKALGLDRMYTDFTFKTPYGAQREALVSNLSVTTLDDIKEIRKDKRVFWTAPQTPYPTIFKEQA